MCGKLYLNLFQKMNQLEKKWQRSKISQAMTQKKKRLRNGGWKEGRRSDLASEIGFLRKLFRGELLRFCTKRKRGTLRKTMQTYSKRHCTLKKTIMFIKKPWYSWWLRNPAITSWYGKYPIIYKVSYMLGGCLGFLPSTPDTFRLVPWGPDTKSLGDARHLFDVKWIPFTRPRRLGDPSQVSWPSG